MPVDLASGDFGELPSDFTYVLHLAVYQVEGLDYDTALRTNAEGTGLLMSHCRNAKAFLHMSTCSVYKPNPDPHHIYTETDPLGDNSKTNRTRCCNGSDIACSFGTQNSVKPRWSSTCRDRCGRTASRRLPWLQRCTRSSRR